MSCISIESAIFQVIFNLGLKCSRRSTMVFGNETNVNKSYAEGVSA